MTDRHPEPQPATSVCGLLLAAGSGRRMGRPKALVSDADGPWLPRAVAVLLDGGCREVVVVLGAGAEEAVTLLDPAVAPVRVVVADDHGRGMSASLAAGLATVPPQHAAVAVLLVDLPDVGADVVSRVLALAAPLGETGLTRAAYDGRPGHPVVLGREHWAGVAESARGDEGARGYLAQRPVLAVECGDLAGGRDVDRPTLDGEPGGAPAS